MCTLKKKDWNIIQATEMKYRRTVKGCTRADLGRNNLDNFLSYETIAEYRDKWKIGGKYILEAGTDSHSNSSP
jgi:hypothetical protein